MIPNSLFLGATMKKRIWELDVLRGIFMIAIIFFLFTL